MRGRKMIDFEVVIDGKNFYMSWKKLTQWLDISSNYSPSTPELAAIKLQMEKALEADSVTVRINRQPIL